MPDRTRNKKNIPYSRQYIDNDDIRHVVNVLKSDFLTQGPAVEEFEKKIAAYCDTKYAVAFISGTAALHGACYTAGIGQGDEVITTPLTFAATANSVLYCKGTVVFADIRNDLPLIDPAEIERKITRKTKAIIPVDYSGIPADYNEIRAIAKKRGLVVIGDAAHSLGATYKGKKVGSCADMTMLSFHPVKAITTGEGGMIVTDNKKYYEKLKTFRSHGITKEKKFFKNGDQGLWYHEMQDLGFNYRLTDIQAALGISQLKKIDSFIKKRSSIAKQYTDMFKTFTPIEIIKVPLDRESAWHLFPIRIKRVKNKKMIAKKFHDRGIGVQVHYIPTHLHPYYGEQFGYKRYDFPLSERFYDEELSLPLYPTMTKEDIKRVVFETKSILS